MYAASSSAHQGNRETFSNDNINRRPRLSRSARSNDGSADSAASYALSAPGHPQPGWGSDDTPPAAATIATSASVNGAPDDQPRAAGRPALSMRLVISVFFAATVLVVSAATFAITYLTSIETVEAVGLAYARVLAEAARGRTEALFDVPAAAAVAFARTVRQKERLPLPTDDPTVWGTLTDARDGVTAVFFASANDLSLVSLLFDDGSRVLAGHAVRHPQLGVTAHTMLHAGSINASSPTRCCGTPRQHFVYRSNGTRYPHTLPLAQPVEDTRTAFYQAVRPRASRSRDAFWGPVTFNNLQGVDTSFAVLLVVPVWNLTSTFVGIHTASVTTARLNLFLRELEVTPNTVAFGLISDGTIIASTHEANFQSFTPAPPDAAIASVAANCVHSAALNPTAPTHVVACRSFARDFPYEPLQAVAGDASMMLPATNRSARPAVRIVDTDGDGEVTAVATGIGNGAGPLPLSLLLFVPRRDLLGATEDRRNVVIGIVAVVAVAASLASFAFTSQVLAALKRVAKQMSRTARLRDPDNDSTDTAASPMAPRLGHASRLAEIYDIQRAYGDMAVAIGSFTRYVPRDVVRDLLRSGELCALAMVPRRCTMLFSDIQGFTTMCERVPAADLSELVHGYFERMTRLVGSHGGIVDKFIGDAVMAVWGAPFAIGNAELRATLCGLRMTRETRVAPLAPLFDAAGEVLRIRVGVATGDVLAGNMGSAERMSYTVIGDAVNLAARLESFCKQVGVEMLVCEATASAVDEAITLRLLMKLRVKGKLEGVRVFHPLGTQSRLLPPDLIDGLKAEDAMGMSDSQSVVFSVSAMSDTASQRANGEHISMKGETTLTLYEAAGRLESEPLVVDDDRKAAATAFSQAATAFLRGDFSRTLAVLGDAQSPIQRHFAPGTDGGDGDLVHRRLWNEAERNLQSPDADFDGTITAENK